jgi:hypothetical protein
MIGGRFIKFIGKLEFPSFLIIEFFSGTKLMLERNGELAVLCDDLFDIKGESVVGIDLLLD